MKTRVLIIIGIVIGIVIVAASLSYYVIYDSSTIVLVSCDPRYEQIDDKCVLLKPEQYCKDWCDLQELSSLGCNQPELDYIYRHTNLFDEEMGDIYFREFVGLPDGVTKEKFEWCVDFISEKRTKLLENTQPVFTGTSLLNNIHDQLGGIFANCNCQERVRANPDTIERCIQPFIDWQNSTHYIDNNICEWQKIK